MLLVQEFLRHEHLTRIQISALLVNMSAAPAVWEVNEIELL